MKNKASIFQLVGFGLNNSASNAQWFYLLIFFLVYCTDYLGLSPILIGIMMTLFRIFDGITDPLIGFIIDKTDTKFGKFRPFMFLGTVIMNISFLLMFWGIKFDTNLKNYLYIIICYSFWVIGYTCLTICTKGAQTVLTEDSAQRSLLSGVDTIARIALDFTFMASGMIILNYFGGVKSGVAFRVFALITISITTFCSLCAILGIWKKDNREYYSTSTHTNLKIIDYIDIFKRNKALKALVFSAASTKIALTTVSTVTFYFFTLVATAPGAQLKVNGPMAIVGVISSVVAISLAIRYGRKKAYRLGAIFCIITLIIILLVRPFRPEQILLLVILCTLFNFGKNMTEAQTIPMIADVVDYEKYTNQRFIPGMISTIFSFFDKLISSLAGLLVGFILQLTNYNAEIGLTPQLYVAIVFLYFGVPLIGYALATFGMRYYPIDKELYNKMHTGKM
ncbi:MAG: MFS transporter [Fusobacterium sp.]|nr:MFS transporter [Fusobacterium sp.]MDO5789574.1 MFS transporter [Fusobacterium sp.]